MFTALLFDEDKPFVAYVDTVRLVLQQNIVWKHLTDLAVKFITWKVSLFDLVLLRYTHG
jgi:hypothetical protein